MRALYKSAAGPGLVLTERPEPDTGSRPTSRSGSLRTGICGTDLHIESWDDWAAGAINAPLVPGHEFSGEVVEVGAGRRAPSRSGTSSRARATWSAGTAATAGPAAGTCASTRRASA